MDEDKKIPEEGEIKEEKKEVPPGSESGETPEKKEAPENKVPENLKGKEPGELVKMYGELERKLGEQGHELGEKRKFEQQMSLVLQAIYSDSEMTERVKAKIAELSGQKPKGDTKETKIETKDTETRQAVEAQLIREFENKTGLSNLDSEKRGEVNQKIGQELAEMLDPSGKKTYAEILDSIDLSRLPTYLDKAYKLADLDGEIQGVVQEASVKARQNSNAAIGNIPSGGISASDVTLTPAERETARKMGIPEEDYLKNKKELIEASKK